MIRVAIIGLGFVGLSFASFLGSKGVSVIGVDSNKKKIECLREGLPDFYEPKLEYYLKKGIKNIIFTSKIDETTLQSDFIFITVGTPLNKLNEINLEFIKSVISSISKKLKYNKTKPTIIVKSTVVPGTLNFIKKLLEKHKNKEGTDFELLSNPEFLREGSAIKDTKNPHVVVVGGSNAKPRKKLINFYKKIYPKNQSYFETDTTTAEMIKYANNAFLATKITFINSIANICQKIPGTNVDDIVKVMGMDPRISRLFLNAGPGFGGSCFPKDLQALITYSKNIGYPPKLLETVQYCNTQQVDYIVKLLKKNIKNLRNKKIGILGLAFKENTDDIRESVSINLIKKLLQEKCIVNVHDPKALKNVKKVFKNKLAYFDEYKEIFHNSDCAILMTPWEEYAKINSKLIKRLKLKLFIDTRRFLSFNDDEIKFFPLGVGPKIFNL
uniref:UDP-glucose 6-dehydrogenase n=1 Tax=uncultured marine thaumarchaeote KM3_89_C12 TaxID=1456339 RepID=A0A075I2T1_9ARCH|nr:UDP-glucose 6-dehydrogenase (UGDH, ugd) [uncultured marine thaumarchaeote KM3_89_C12]